MPEQTECCHHDLTILCFCPQGFKSHAKHPDDDECECGKIKVATESWQNCSGMTHVFQPDVYRCGCGQRSRGRPTTETV